MSLLQVSEVWDRQKRVVLGAFLSVLFLALVGSLIIRPTYVSCSKVVIPEASDGVLSMGGVDFDGAQFAVPRLDVGIEKTLATPVSYINRAVFKLQLRNEDGALMGRDELSPDSLGVQIARWLFPRPGLRIRAGTQSDILEVEARSSDGKHAAFMANTLAGIVVAEVKEDVRTSLQSAKSLLERRMSEIRGDYESRLKTVADLDSENKSVDLETETRLAAEKTSDLLRERDDTIVSLSQVRAKMSYLQQELGKQNGGFASAVAVQENPHLGDLKKTLAELHIKLAEARAEYTQEHPHVVAIEEQIAALEGEIAKEIDVYRSSALDLTGLASEASALEARLASLNTGIDEHLGSLKDLPGKASQRAGLEIGLADTERTYSALLRSLEGVNLAQAGGLAAVRIVEPARVPRNPIFPNVPLNLFLASLVGLLFGLSLATLRECLDDTVKSAKDVKALVPKAFVGAVPALADNPIALISGRDTNDPFYESYRMVRTHLELVEDIREGRMRSLLITSAGPGEGKSTTVANLGIAIANDGKKVVLVDTDVRRPSLDRYFALGNEVGLTDVLQERAVLGDAIWKSCVDNLSVMVSGTPYEDPGRLLESYRMSCLLRKLQKEFDVVILDSAPLLVKSDALGLARMVDSSVIVVESRRTTRGAFHQLIEIFERTHITPLGFILNKHPAGGPDDAYYRYCTKPRPLETVPRLREAGRSSSHREVAS